MGRCEPILCLSREPMGTPSASQSLAQVGTSLPAQLEETSVLHPQGQEGLGHKLGVVSSEPPSWRQSSPLRHCQNSKHSGFWFCVSTADLCLRAGRSQKSSLGASVDPPAACASLHRTGSSFRSQQGEHLHSFISNLFCQCTYAYVVSFIMRHGHRMH